MALDLNNMHLTFDEEFNSLSLYNGVSGTWNPTYGYGSNLNNFASHVHGEEKQIYVDPAFTGTTSAALGVNPFSIQDGILNITAAPTSSALMDALGGYQYTSGLITTQQSFQQTYGYFEMSAKLPEGQGFWPAFWLLPAGGWGPPELDVMEMLGNNPSTIYTTAHSTATGQLQSTTFASNVADTSAGFHSYGVDWEPDQITWYFDGQPVAQTATPPDMHSPMYMLANLAVGGNWPGAPDATTSFPSNMQIDYIRAYASGAGPSGEGATASGGALDAATAGAAVTPEADHAASTGGTTTAAAGSAIPDTNLASESGRPPTSSGSTTGATTAAPDANLASESQAASPNSGAATTTDGNVTNVTAHPSLADHILGTWSNRADASHANHADMGSIFHHLANISLGGLHAHHSHATADVDAIIADMQTANPLPFGGLTHAITHGAEVAGMMKGLRGDDAALTGGIYGTHGHTVADMLSTAAVQADAAAAPGGGTGAGGCSHDGQGGHGGSVAGDVAGLLHAMQKGYAIKSPVTPFDDLHNPGAAEPANATAALNNHHFEALWHH